MSSVYLVNVGTNATHKSKARSPIFGDGSFVYVSYPDDNEIVEYSPNMRHFVRDPDEHRTHSDPDWDNSSYGDDCSNPRAYALKNVTPGDILLFWGLLWQKSRRNNGHNWHACGFTGEKGWYLLGTLRVEEIVEGGQHINQVTPQNRDRAHKTSISLGILCCLKTTEFFWATKFIQDLLIELSILVCEIKVVSST
ncbi:MAG: hypothetical protein ABIF19_16840 [Planctomycetota bacterium]